MSNRTGKKIVIATPLYPPDVGGPSQYAKNLAAIWRREGHQVTVLSFGAVRRWPSGLRHFLYFFKLWPAACRADFIFILDTFSVALPAVLLGKLLGKKTIIRTGGDFLWENYVERTGDLVLLRNFYPSRSRQFNWKEKIIYRLTDFVLGAASLVVFSTKWQQQIFCRAYRLPAVKTALVENYYGPAESASSPAQKIFIAATRPLAWKNHERLRAAFALAKRSYPDIILDESPAPHVEFMNKIKTAYAVILVSLGDISPNLILDAIRYRKPFILTRENGLEERLLGFGLRANPEDIADIAAKISQLSDERSYHEVQEKLKQFDFRHSWEEIGREFLALSDQP